MSKRTEAALDLAALQLTHDLNAGAIAWDEMVRATAVRMGCDISRPPVFDPKTMTWGWPIPPEGARFVSQDGEWFA